jgi:hypothetical protein
MKKIICLVLVLTLCLGFAACGQTPSGTETIQPTYTQTQPTAEQTQPSEPKELTAEEKILAERRDAVEQHMRRNATLLWRSTEDITYTLGGTAYTFRIVAGRLYKGMPYSYAGNSVESFLDYAGEPDAKGIYTISGLSAEALSGSGSDARIGNDCSSAVQLAWGQVSTTIEGARTATMMPQKGYIPVGGYEYSSSKENEQRNTKEVILKNGRETIYQAYAQLQKGDCLVYVTQSGHAIMAVSVNVVYDAEGKIDPRKSIITYLDQTSTKSQAGSESSYYDEALGEKVYVIGNIDQKYTFKALADKGFLPFTCKELIDPAPVAASAVNDSQTSFTKDTILTGTITSNRFIESVTIKITDSQGAAVQQATAYGNRASYKSIDLQRFVTDLPEQKRGSIDLTALAAGSYHCTLVCRLTTGEEFTVRDFDFGV